jgi:hypothetical protein
LNSEATVSSGTVQAYVDAIVDRNPLRLVLIALKAIVVGYVANIYALLLTHHGWSLIAWTLSLIAHPHSLIHEEATVCTVVMHSSGLLLFLTRLSVLSLLLLLGSIDIGCVVVLRF